MRTLTESLEEDGREPQRRDWISSLEADATGAQRFGALARGHWTIENGSHRQRDTLWREDHQCMKHHGRAHILASLRQLALCLHRSGKVQPKAMRTSHQIKRLSHAPGTAMPLKIINPRE
ncbi:MAG: hypothetical protein ACKVY0_16765 [Prosthecobacter sp.]|uniref:hypothetical protein n=1 Tax=Prosthecobacter sp. TaxID=1965333 RepID=UPI003901D539